MNTETPCPRERVNSTVNIRPREGEGPRRWVVGSAGPIAEGAIAGRAKCCELEGCQRRLSAMSEFFQRRMRRRTMG